MTDNETVYRIASTIDLAVAGPAFEETVEMLTNLATSPAAPAIESNEDEEWGDPDQRWYDWIDAPARAHRSEDC